MGVGIGGPGVNPLPMAVRDYVGSLLGMLADAIKRTSERVLGPTADAKRNADYWYD